MIKKIIMMGLVCFYASFITAQVIIKLNLPTKQDTEVSPIVKEKIDEYATKINNIIQEEKKLMDLELEFLAKENLAQAEFNKKKAEIADRYSLKIDNRIEALGFDMDEIIQKQVRYSLLNSDITSNEELKAKLMKKFRAVRNLSPYFSYGIMTLTNDQPDNNLDKNIAYSNNLELGMKLNYQFDRMSPWGLISGVGLSWRTIRLDNNKFFSKDANGEVSVANYAGNIDKNKMRTGYLMVPLGLQYNFSKLKNAGMDVQYKPYSSGFRVAANMYGGVKMSTNNIIRGDAEDFRNRSNYQVNPFVYGGQFTFSYNGLSLFVKKDFSNYFKGNLYPNDKALVIGIGLGL